MPDFNTRRLPQPPSPARLRIVSMANKVRTLLPLNRIVPWLPFAGMFLFVVVVLLVGLIHSPNWLSSRLWLATHHDSQEVPRYKGYYDDSRDCPQYVRFEGTTCYDAYTNTRNGWALALITQDIGEKDQPYISSVLQVTFYSDSQFDSAVATGYYFEDKSVADDVLSDAELRRATVIDGDYVFIDGLT